MALPDPVPAAAGAYPARSGNLVRPIVDGVPAFRRLAEAIRVARHSVWLTIAFHASDFRFPDGRGRFDVLDDADARGLAVRVLFWRPNPESSRYGRTFPGTEADRKLLRGRGSRFGIRWDRAEPSYCQHQKSWLIDAGHPTETAVFGGINLTAKALGSPGHRDGGRHDLYVEITGPSATDVHHNFVQRWNETSERTQADGTWDTSGASPLPFPSRASAPRGTSVVQVQRMAAALPIERITNTRILVRSPPKSAQASYQSTWASWPRAWLCGTSVPRAARPIVRLRILTWLGSCTPCACQRQQSEVASGSNLLR